MHLPIAREHRNSYTVGSEHSFCLLFSTFGKVQSKNKFRPFMGMSLESVAGEED